MKAAITPQNSARGPAIFAALRTGALLLSALTLSGCVGYASIRAGQPLPAAPAASAPTTTAATTAAAPAPRVVTPPPASTPAPAPAAPAAPAGPLDARSGLHQASVVSISGGADSRYTVLFRPALTEPSRIEAAPAQLCRQAGRSLKSSKTNKPGSSSAMPGVQMMIVECGAA